MKIKSFSCRYMCLALIFFPVLSLVLRALAWLRYGIDIPWFDDWRGYVDGNIDSLAPAYLFRPVNDTLAPVGFALDALAQRYLDGNSIAYQLISMIVVLGGLMWLQWKLLIESLGDRLQASVCFLLVLFMLQPDSYWGWENLAYHQVLPLVFILAAIFLVVFSKIAIEFSGPLVFVVGIISGFTYISGAIGVLVCAVAILILSIYLFSGDDQKDLKSKSLWLLASGLFSVAVQIYFAFLKARGTHTGVPLALPSDLDFWLFYMGKIGRSLLLPQQWLLTSFFITAVIIAISLVMGGLLFSMGRKNQNSSLRGRKAIVVYFSLGAVICVYLGMVSAGRANFRPEDIENPLDIYSYGFYRFHYFWVTLFWPWLMVGFMVLAKERKIFLGKGIKCIFIGMGGLLFFATAKSGIFSHFDFQKSVADVREATAKCLLESVQRGMKIHCQGLAPPRGDQDIPDSFPGYAYAYKKNASFVRGFPLLFEDNASVDEKYLFDEKEDGYEYSLSELKYLSPGHYISQGLDSQVNFPVDLEKLMKGCTVIDFVVSMGVEKDATAQIFYLTPGESEFGERNSKQLIIKAADKSLQLLHFRLESSTGFHGGVRFDPVNNIQNIHLGKIKARCRMTNN